MENLIRPDFSQTLRVVKPFGPPKRMLELERDGNQTHVRINASSLSLLQTCMRKSQYVLHEKWRPKSGSLPLIFGTAIHKALEVFYLSAREKRVFPANFDEVAPLIAQGHAAPENNVLYWALQAFVTAGEALRGLPDDDKRSLSSGVWILSHYFKVYANDVYVTFGDSKGPVIERQFECLLNENRTERVTLHGQIDFALKNEASGEVLIGDHKTSSQMGADFLNRIKPNHQYTGYMLGAREVLGLTGENFLVNGIQVKAQPKTARGGPPMFTRQITRRTEADFQEFRQAVLFAVSNYLAADEFGVWPLGNVDACSGWGGCQFLEVCSAPNELRQNILESKFEKGSNA